MKRAAFLSITVLCLAFFLKVATVNETVSAKADTTLPDRQTGVRRALLIGVSKYDSDRFPSLEYPRNDVARMKELLESPRYGFKVTVLSDDICVGPDNKPLSKEQCKPDRKNILAAIQKTLIDDAQPGDFCLFYFSGHGSRVRNSKSDFGDGWDETIVPADAMRPVRSRESLKDIRNKEIVEFFNRSMDKGIKLTAIFDSCHSGSIARGDGQSKEIEEADIDIATPPTEAQKIKPEDRGALILTAAEDHQQASGGQYTLAGHEAQYSHFTAELLQTLYEDPADGISVGDVFRRVLARLVGAGRSQTPKIRPESGSRLEQTIFGSPTRAVTGRATVPVTTVTDRGIKHIVLAGGVADGLAVGDELRRIDLATRKETDPAVTVRITAASLSMSNFQIVDPNNRSLVEPLRGIVKDGEMFEQKSWVYRREPNLTVWLPAATLDDQKLKAVSAELDKLKAAGSVTILAEPAIDRDQTVVFAESLAAKTSWKIRLQNGKIESIGTLFTADAVLESLARNRITNTRIFIDLPPTASVKKAVESSLSGGDGGITLASKREAGIYELVGQYDAANSSLHYAWVLRSSLLASPNAEKSGSVNLQPTLPPVTNWVDGRESETAAAELKTLALRLGRVRSWLTLSSPIAPGSLEFPYRVEIREVGDPLLKKLKAGDAFYKNRKYEMILTASPELLKNNVRLMTDFWIYVMNIDCNGKATFALTEKKQTKEYAGISGFDPLDPPLEIPLINEMSMWSPYGTEAFILLVTDKPLPNVEPFNFAGVRGKEFVEKGASSQLDDVLHNIGVDVASRGEYSSNNIWAVQHLVLRSAESPSSPGLCIEP